MQKRFEIRFFLKIQKEFPTFNRTQSISLSELNNDYMINLKSEIEIQALHEKIDHFVLNQQQELLEFQKTQIEMLHEMMNQLEEKG